MTIGRVSVNGLVKGIGFAIGPRLALTARHVIKEALDEHDIQRAGCTVTLTVQDGTPYKVEIGTCSRSLDVASLVLAADLASWLEAVEPKDGGKWRVESRPRDDDPMLSGSITTRERLLTTEMGEEVPLLQLQVYETLGDYGGYSGSPVQFEDPEGSSKGLIGILIEQARWRTRVPGQIFAPVANVLYAAPIDKVLGLLGIEGQPLLDANLAKYRERMKRIETVERESDRDLVREVRREVIIRYVFGE